MSELQSAVSGAVAMTSTTISPIVTTFFIRIAPEFSGEQPDGRRASNAFEPGTERR